MGKDQAYGLAIFLISVVILIGYLTAFFAPLLGLPTYWRDSAIGVPVLLFVILVLLISGWIGWTMLTTPPPASLEAETSPSNSTSREERQ